MAVETLFLSMVVAAFGVFITVVGGVSTWIRYSDWKAARVTKAQPAAAYEEPLKRAA